MCLHGTKADWCKWVDGWMDGWLVSWKMAVNEIKYNKVNKVMMTEGEADN